MTLQPPSKPSPFSPAREDACDDADIPFRHHSNKPARIILADDHPVVLMGAQMAIGDTFSVVAHGRFHGRQIMFWQFDSWLGYCAKAAVALQG